MRLDIVAYGHPALRAKGRDIPAIDERVRALARDMIETMADANGVGLAAQQVGMPLQLCVIDVRGAEDRPSGLWIDGQPADIDAAMPMVLINPRLFPSGDPVAETEGCLSFPGLQGEIPRPPRVRVEALDIDGKPIAFEADGLLARAIQHEVDHLQGILFIDRMSPPRRRELLPDLEKLLSRSDFNPPSR